MGQLMFSLPTINWDEEYGWNSISSGTKNRIHKLFSRTKPSTFSENTRLRNLFNDVHSDTLSLVSDNENSEVRATLKYSERATCLWQIKRANFRVIIIWKLNKTSSLDNGWFKFKHFLWLFDYYRVHMPSERRKWVPVGLHSFPKIHSTNIHNKTETENIQNELKLNAGTKLTYQCWVWA